jgi:hypothetical protein
VPSHLAIKLQAFVWRRTREPPSLGSRNPLGACSVTETHLDLTVADALGRGSALVRCPERLAQVCWITMMLSGSDESASAIFSQGGSASPRTGRGSRVLASPTSARSS